MVALSLHARMCDVTITLWARVVRGDFIGKVGLDVGLGMALKNDGIGLRNRKRSPPPW